MMPQSQHLVVDDGKDQLVVVAEMIEQLANRRRARG